MLLEPLYLWLLNRISRVTSHLGRTARALIVFGCFLIIGIIFSLYPRTTHDDRRMAIISLIVLTVIFAWTEGEMKPVRWNKPIALSIELFAVLMIVIRLIHPVGQGYMIYALDILILFPMLYTVLLNRRNQTRFTDLLTCAVVVAGLICFVLSILLALSGKDYVYHDRVYGITTNPNYYGIVGLSLVMASLYNIVRERDNLCWELIMSVSVGIGVSMILSSVSRTAMLAAIGCFAVFIIYAVRALRSGSDRKETAASSGMKRLLTSIAVALLMILSVFAAQKAQTAVYFPAQSGDIIHIAVGQAVYAEDGVEDADDESQSIIKDRWSTEYGINTFSSGRFSTWRFFILNMNMLGHDYDAEKESGMLSTLKVTKTHNNIIDYAFRFGVPVGLVYSFYYILILIGAAKMAFRKRHFTAMDMWVVMTVAAYAVYAMIEVATLPFTRYQPCLFFLSAAPLMGKVMSKE